MVPPKPKLSFYSYDSLENPWCAGGGALRDLEVLKRFASRWEVTLYVARFPGFVPREVAGVRIRGLGGGRSNLACRMAFSLTANLRVLTDRAQVIGNSISIYAPIFTGLLRRRRFFLVAPHYVGRDSLKKFGIPGWFPFVFEWILFRFARNAIVLNGAVERRIRAMNPGARLFRSATSVDEGLLKVAPWEASPPYILFLGRFDIHMKGLDLLLEAYRRTSEEMPDAPKLVLAGAASPQGVAAVRKLVPDRCAARVELRPNVPEAEKRDLLAGCLFFCSPSRFEGFGIAALEANAAGKAVLVTDTDGFRDSVSKDVSARVVAVGDVEGMAAGMLELIRDADLRRRLGEGGREWAAGFSWDRIADAEAQWIANGFQSGGPAPGP